MAALACLCAPATASWKEKAAPTQQKGEPAAQDEAAAYEAAKRTSTSKIISRKRSEAGGGQEDEVWEGVVRREIRAGVEEVWEMLGKFSGMKRWNATAEVCELVEGKEGEVGCVRYCAGGGRWVKEKLVELQPTQRSFTYTIIDSSYGFQGYVATLSLLPIVPSGALVNWSFRLDPVPHLTRSKLLDQLTFIFDRMMGSLEETILSASRSSAEDSVAPTADH